MWMENLILSFVGWFNKWGKIIKLNGKSFRSDLTNGQNFRHIEWRSFSPSVIVSTLMFNFRLLPSTTNIRTICRNSNLDPNAPLLCFSTAICKWQTCYCDQLYQIAIWHRKQQQTTWKSHKISLNNSCFLQHGYAMSCCFHVVSSFSTVQKNTRLTYYFWWLNRLSLVVAFGFLPQNFGRWREPTNCHFAWKGM